MVSPLRARARRKPRRRGRRSGASRAKRRSRPMPVSAWKRRSPSISAAVADRPDSPRSDASGGSWTAPPSSWIRTSVSSSLSTGTGATSPWNQARNRASNSPARSRGGASAASAARRTSPMPRGPRSSTAARKVTVCSGEVVKPKPRRNGGNAARWRAAAGTVGRSFIRSLISLPHRQASTVGGQWRVRAGHRRRAGASGNQGCRYHEATVIGSSSIGYVPPMVRGPERTAPRVAPHESCTGRRERCSRSRYRATGRWNVIHSWPNVPSLDPGAPASA